MITYIIIFVLLLLAELVYFRIADKYNIIDKPNQKVIALINSVKRRWPCLPDWSMGMERILWL